MLYVILFSLSSILNIRSNITSSQPAMSVVDALRQNNPATTSIIIHLRHETSDADLAQALEQNPFITEIDLYLNDGAVRGLDWNSLLRVIAMRANLETVKVQDEDSTEIQRHAPAALVSTILRAIQQNAAIRNVSLLHLRLSPDVPSTFVDIASSITTLVLLKCEIMAPSSVERERGLRDLAAALQRNTNIKSLQLGYLDEVSNCAILQGLQSNTSVNSLIFGGLSLPDTTAGAIQQLLQSTVSIDTFGFCGTSFNNGDMFPSIAQQLIQSPIVCVLQFLYCHFRDEEYAALFRGILQNKQNLTWLCLDHCTFSGGPVPADIISALLQPDSPLRRFELKEHSLGDTLPNSRFQNLLRAVKRSKLEKFLIGVIQTQQQLRTLTDSIPLMRIKALYVVVDIDFGEENYKQLFLQAAKNNFSLRFVDGNSASGRDLFNDNDKTRLVFYANRNELLDQWVDNPERIQERKVWPEALKLAEKAGHDSLFRGLRAVLGGDYVSLRASGRKHKHTQYDAPS